MRNKFLRRDLAAGNKINSCRITSCRIPDRPSYRQVPYTSRGDGENNILPPHTRLNIRPTLFAEIDARLDAGLCTGGVDNDVRAFAELEFRLDLLGNGGTPFRLGVRGIEIAVGLKPVCRHLWGEENTVGALEIVGSHAQSFLAQVDTDHGFCGVRFRHALA